MNFFLLGFVEVVVDGVRYGGWVLVLSVGGCHMIGGF